MNAPRKQPQDHNPPAGDAPKPEGWELLKPFDQVPVWEQTELIAIVQPLLADAKVQEGAIDIATFDVRLVGTLAQKLIEYAVDPAAYRSFVSGPGALARAMNLGLAYATQLGE